MDKIKPKEAAKPWNWKAQSIRQSILIVCFVAAMLYVCWIEESSWGVFAIIILLIALVLTYIPMKASWVRVIGGAVVVLLLAIFALSNYVSGPPGAKTQANLQHIQLSIERYAVNNEGEYPIDLSVLIQEGYIDAFPWNEFVYENQSWLHANGLPREEMDVATQMRELRYTQALAGNFAYLPHLETDGNGKLHATDYDFIAFGGYQECHHTKSSRIGGGFPVLKRLSSEQSEKVARLSGN